MTVAPIVCRNCSAQIVRAAFRGEQCPFCLLPWAVLILRDKKTKGRPIKRGGFNNAPPRLMAIGHRCGWMCYLCGENVPMPGVVDDDHPKHATVDHVIPRSRGGKGVWTNLAITHSLCNNRRGNTAITQEQALRLRALERTAS